MSVFYVPAVVVTVLLVSLPHFFNRQGPLVQIQSTISQLSTIHGGQEDPAVPIAGKQHQNTQPTALKAPDSLEEVLAQASMSIPFSKTVIITSLNAAWSASNSSMVDMFLSSFHSGEGTEILLKHVVIVCVDQKAFERCVEIHDHCFRMVTPGVDFAGEKEFMSEDFVNMMWRRIQFLGEVLQLGYSFIFSDADILWLRNPLSVFSETMDFQISTDRFHHRPFDLRSNWPNSGFLYTRSNNRTIELYRLWHALGQRSPGKNDQHVLTALFQHHPGWIREMGLTVQFYDTVYFSGFCQVSRDMSKVVTMHSNCCIGLSSKLHDLRLAREDWKAYRDAAADPRSQGNYTQSRIRQKLWRVPSECDFQ